ncbi:MAG: serine protease [Deltaproteobacteria bacterium]|nr:serine protease [Deltaproteobacteria bacterium]
MYQLVRCGLMSIAIGGSLLACKTTGRSGSDPKVIGGSRVVAAQPYIVGLSEEVSKGSFFCGGTYLGGNVVLTAAHCVANLSGQIYASIGVASAEAALKASFIKVVGVVVHPDWGRVGDRDGDVALLFLDKTATGLPADPGIELERVGALAGGETLTAIGYGNISSIGIVIPGDLRQTDLQPVALNDCRAKSTFYKALSERQMCAAGATDGQDACNGDSGGPLIVKRAGKPVLVGVISFGDGCGQRLKPGVYARVAAFAKWIDDTIAAHKAEPAVLQGGEPAAMLGHMIQKYCYAQEPVINQSVSTIGTVTIQRLAKPSATYKQVADAAEFLASRRDEDVKSWCQFETFGGAKLAVDVVMSKPLLSSKINQQLLLKRADTGAYLFDIGDDARYAIEKCAIQGPPAIQAVSYTTTDQGFFVGTDQGVYKGKFSSKGANGLTDTLETCGSGGTEIKLYSSADHTLLTLRLKLGRWASEQWVELTKLPDQPQVDASLVTLASGRHTLTLANHSPVGLFSWELSCPFDFTLTSKDHRTFKARLGSDLRYNLRFEHPAQSLAQLEVGKQMQFGMDAPSINTLEILSEADSGCKINGSSPVILQ